MPFRWLRLSSTFTNVDVGGKTLPVGQRRLLAKLAESGGGTRLFDAIVQASDTVLKNQKPRKAMIVLSDGGDNGSNASLADAIEAAQRADTLIYSSYFTDSSFPIPFGGSDGRGNLGRLAKETGASFYEVTKKQGINEIYQAIQDELRSQYSLGFVSDQPNEISEFRMLKLSTKQKGLAVHFRERYWAAA